MIDTVLDAMATQLAAMLRARGLDPTDPPTESGRPPSDKAFAEYQRRGGAAFTDPEEFIDALVERTGAV